MKRFITYATLFGLISAPAFAGSVEIKVPVNPASADEAMQIRDQVFAAAEELCAQEQLTTSYTMTRKTLERQCVETTVQATIEQGRSKNLSVFMDESIFTPAL